MLLDCDACGNEIREYPSVLAGLADNRILTVTRMADGRFRVAEACDDWFDARLTADQLAALGRELIELANAPREAGAAAPSLHADVGDDLDVADCAVTLEEARGVIRRMERRIREQQDRLNAQAVWIAELKANAEREVRT